nr:hypothetical protein [Corynebacterium flavescens]
MHQEAARSLVDVLTGGNQADTELVELGVDGDVVGPVTSQAVDLMDDDVVDIALLFFKVTQQGFESWAVSACAGDSTFYELFGHYCAQTLGFLPVGVSLGWNGEAFRLPTLAGLLAGRNA